MFDIKFDLESVKKNMLEKGTTFKHNTGKRAKLFPFAANDSKVSKLEDDLVDFGGIAAACYRECSNTSHKTNFNKVDFLTQACSIVDTDKVDALKDIIEKVAFDEAGRLYPFDIKAYAHLAFTNKSDTSLINISRYIVSTLFDEGLKTDFQAMGESAHQNLLYRLLCSAFPAITEYLNEDDHYYLSSQPIKSKFKQDFNFLTANKEKYKFVDYFPTLIKFYFFRHITEVCLELNSFVTKSKKPTIFFSLEWEKLQGSRPASNNGWKLFEGMLDSTFIHANTFELLSYINLPIASRGYKEIEAFVKGASDSEKNQLIDAIGQIIEFYKDKNPHVEWAPFVEAYNVNPKSTVQSLIIGLWGHIEHQFTTTRKRQLRAYKQLFVQFAKLNFGKKRGRNGYSLGLKHADVLFLTTLSIGAHEKIRLIDLRKEFEERGIYLDGKSWGHLVEYYEKVNMLEKKSDSGDGQYVKHLN
jgi:DNA phosphorothioation-dependent restriction protein DptG